MLFYYFGTLISGNENVITWNELPYYNVPAEITQQTLVGCFVAICSRNHIPLLSLQAVVTIVGVKLPLKEEERLFIIYTEMTVFVLSKSEEIL